MSLQVWLPLNSDILNQGISDAIFTGTPTYGDGKLGKCLTNGTITSTNTTIPVTITTNPKYSICAWVKTTSTSVWVWRIGDGTGTSRGLWIGGANTGPHFAYSGSGAFTGNIAINNGVWHHVCFTVDGATASAYVDGVYCGGSTSVKTDPVSGNAIYLFATSTCALQDFRIYDHCLSLREVKELSKGLVCHYTLSGAGNPNILHNTDFTQTYAQTTGWNTSKNGTILASYWGGYNPGVANASTCYHAHLEQMDGEYVYKYVRESETWLGIQQSDNLRTRIAKNTVYTFSVDQLITDGSNNFLTGGLYYYNTAGTRNFNLGQFNFSGKDKGRWVRCTYTFTIPSDIDLTKEVLWYIYGHGSGAGTVYMRHPKLELGNHATPWCPYSADPAYAAMGYNDTIESDVSGNGYDCTKIDTITVDENTARYSSSLKFNNGLLSSTARVPGGDSVRTMAAWVYVNKYCTGDVAIILNCGTYLVIKNDGKLGAYAYGKSPAGYHYGSHTIPLNTWTHLAVKWDASYVYGYINGAQDFKVACTGTFTYQNLFYIGRDNTNTARSYYGNISDLRMYATCLSEADIKELYNTPVSITNNGAMLIAGEIVEV